MDVIINETLVVEEINMFAKKLPCGGEMFLHYADGVPYKEIAVLFKKPIGTVKANIFSARGKIAEKLTGEKRIKKLPKNYHQFKKIKKECLLNGTLSELVLVEK